MEEEQEEMTDEECLRYLEWWKQTGPLLEKGEVGGRGEKETGRDDSGRES